MKIKEFCDKYVGDRDFPIKAVLNEAVEVFSARSKQNLIEEINDVSFTFQIWLHKKTNMNWNMIWPQPSVDKMEDRLIEFKKIFQRYNLQFDPKYWEYGSNYKKEAKVQAALALASKDQS